MTINFALSILCLLFVSGWAFADGPAAPVKGSIGSSSYHMAYVDVKDDAHNYEFGKEPGNDESFIRGEISSLLDERGIERSFSPEADVDLRVICRFKHGVRKSVVTPGFQIKSSFVNQCTLRIEDKKTGRILIERAYVWNKDNGDVADFIKQVFTEWKGRREKNSDSHTKSNSNSKK